MCRWKQRFQNLEKAYAVFQRRIDDYKKEDDNEAYQMSLIQAFEITIELSWKTLKDYLANEEKQVNSPKEVIRQSFQYRIIEDGEEWMEALAKRNLTTHTYDENTFKEILIFINEKFSYILEKLYLNLKKEIN